MPLPLISVLMPIYNCSEFARGNGRILLTEALDSLLAQTYPHFEILLLDNQSTDRTPEICAQYAARDSRIHYMTDTHRRSIDDAFAYLPSIMNGAYCFCANDDDIFHPEYIDVLQRQLEQNPNIDLVYPNCDYIDVNGSTVTSRVVSGHIAYNPDAGPFGNFCRYVKGRNPIPFIFGMFRAEAYRGLQPTVAFDELGANVDNLQLLKFFAGRSQSLFYDKTLFYYRTKARPLRGPDTPHSRFPKDFPPFEEPLLIWAYYVRHQFRFRQAIENLIASSRFMPAEKSFLQTLAAEAFIYHCLNLLEWIRKDETPPDDRVTHTRIAKLGEQIRRDFAEINMTDNAVLPQEYHLVISNKFFVGARREIAREHLARFAMLIRTCSDMFSANNSLLGELVALLQEELPAVA